MTAKRIGARDLGIDLSRNTDSQTFKWLVACLLFGARIKQEIAAATYRELEHEGVLTPHRLANANWQHLVNLLGEGGYKRYDESTARELIKLGKDVENRYHGSLAKVWADKPGRAEVSRRLQEFTGIGPTAADIFMRDARV